MHIVIIPGLLPLTDLLWRIVCLAQSAQTLAPQFYITLLVLGSRFKFIIYFIFKAPLDHFNQ